MSTKDHPSSGILPRRPRHVLPLAGARRLCCVIHISLSLSAAWFSIAPAALGQPVFLEKVIYQRSPSPAVSDFGFPHSVAEYVKMLSDESSEKRSAAARELLKMGPAIEPQLQWALRNGENEGRPLSWNMYQVREGNQWLQDPRNLRPWHAENELDVLLSHLQERRRSPASIITLHHRDAFLTNVLCDLARQADTDLAVGNFYSPLDWVATNRVTVNVSGVDFWEALRAIQQSTGLTPFHGTGQNRLVLQKGALSSISNVPGAVVSGVLQIAPISIVREGPTDPVSDFGIRTLPLRKKFGPRISDFGIPHPGAVRLTLTALAEPKLSETGPHALVRIAECVDDQGRSLIANDKRMFGSIESHQAWSWTVPVELGPLPPGRRIKRLKGEFSVGFGLMDRYMTIANLLNAQGRAREFDGLNVVVRQVSKTGSQYQVDVDLSAPSDSPFTRTFSAASELEVWLWQESTQTIVSQKIFRGFRHEAGRTVGTWSLITPENSLPPATLVWKTPTETRWHTVPFELREIAVP